MQGLPMYNPKLVVEAVGFRVHDGRQVGVIVTPWFMNLTVLPTQADLAHWRKGAVADLAFPSGRYEFVVGDAAANELIATRGLFSPMHEFAAQSAAQSAALAAVQALFEPELPRAPDGPSPARVFSRRTLFGG